MSECQNGYACEWGICTSKRKSNPFPSRNSSFTKTSKDKRDCTDDSMCKTGHYCSRENSKCERQLALFSRCSYDSQCEQPFVCQENVCQLKYQSTILKGAAFVTGAIIIGILLLIVILGLIGYLIWSRRSKIQKSVSAMISPSVSACPPPAYQMNSEPTFFYQAPTLLEEKKVSS
jgi:hypothetical protein